MKYKCDICNVYFYESSDGDEKTGIKAGIKPEDFPDDWKCPICQADKTHMIIEEDKVDAPDDFTVSDLMIKTLLEWGVDTVFGMVGHSNLGLANAIRKQEEKGKLKFIGIRHEGAGAFAASAYGKLTGKPAVCLAIAGPGATNMLTGLWDAKMDRAPVIALVGQVNAQVLGRGYFQEIDLKSAYQAVSAWSQLVLHDSDHSELAALAVKKAKLNRDVSSLIVPDEIQTAKTSAKISGLNDRITEINTIPSDKQINTAIDLLQKAKKPVIIAGHGAMESMPKITKFAEKFNIPIVTTFKAKGQIADSHPLACGVLGRSGIPVSIWAIDQADLLLVFGASFSQHTGISNKKTTIQVDYDPQAIAKFHKIKAQVLGEIGAVVDIFLEKIKINNNDLRLELAKQWADWREEKKKRARIDNNKGLASAFVFEVLNKYVPSDAVISLDVGNNAYSFGRYFECKQQSMLMSGYLGSIGFGYPAAIGAWAAAPNRSNIVITGDGGFGQYLAEVTTAVKYKMPIKHILLNNSELGKITLEQESENIPVWKTYLHNPNFSKYAENCGALGIRVSEREDLEPALVKLFEHKGPGIVEIITDASLT